MDIHSIKKTPNLAGKIITLIQLVISIVCLIIVGTSGFIPGKYLDLFVIMIFVLFGITFSLQFIKGKSKFAGMVVSVVFSAILILAMFGIAKVNTLLDEVGGAEYKTDNMVVVVRTDDSAKTLEGAKDYKFAVQMSTDKENTALMCTEIENVTGKKPDVKEYATVHDIADALLDQEVDAIIYNSAFDGVLEDKIKGYSEKTRVLHQYGVRTEITREKTENQNVEQPFNVYISGIDVAGDISVTSRSDVNIILTVNPNTKKILLTTTPRDYYVPIPEISDGIPDKLTHAGIYGVDASMRTLEQLYGIEFSYYARVNFSSVETIINALGGVEVYSDYTFDSRGYSFTEGWNYMDGGAALAFSRERYSFEDGDNQRGKNQQRVIEACLNKAMTPAILRQANQLLTALGQTVETNMTRDEMIKFVNMQLGDNAAWTIESNAVTGYGDYGTCYSSGDEMLYVMYPDETSVQAASDWINKVLAGE